MGYLQPIQKTSRWQFKRPELHCRSTVQSTAQRSNFDPMQLPVDRPVDLNKPRAKLLSVGRPLGRPAHWAARRAQVCARRSTVRSTGPWCGRPLGRPTRPVSLFLGQKNCLKNIEINPTKSLKFHKNSFVILNRNTNFY